MVITLNQLLQTQEDLQHHIRRTPIQTRDQLNHWTGKKVFIKPEYMQYTQSFKYRGAFHFLNRMDHTKYDGIIAGSSGNHGLALSTIASKLNIPVTICMAKDASLNKKQKIKALQACLLEFDRFTQDRDQVTKEYAEQHRLCIVPSSDHPDIIAGAGTIGLELLQQIPTLDAILVPIGGGGLASGVALAAHAINPHIQVIGVEPITAQDAKLSLESGHIVTIDSPTTIADGLRHNHVGQLTFEIMQRELTDIITVSEVEIEQAMYSAHHYLDFPIEPSAAVVIAALLSNQIPDHLQHIGLVLSGGNYEQYELERINRYFYSHSELLVY